MNKRRAYGGQSVDELHMRNHTNVIATYENDLSFDVHFRRLDMCAPHSNLFICVNSQKKKKEKNLNALANVIDCRQTMTKHWLTAQSI